MVGSGGGGGDNAPGGGGGHGSPGISGTNGDYATCTNPAATDGVAERSGRGGRHDCMAHTRILS